jgi:hypothetical protein
VEPVQSPDEEQPMDRNTEENTAQIGYEFEVKEQDRWLPIANGTSISLHVSPVFDLPARDDSYLHADELLKRAQSLSGCPQAPSTRACLRRIA